MRIKFLYMAMTSFALVHAAVPPGILFQGLLTNEGKPISGSQELEVKLCTSESVGANDCQNVYQGSVVVKSGYYTVLLSNLPVMDKPYWLEVYSNGVRARDRVLLTASPYAHFATLADSALVAKTAWSTPQAEKADSANRCASATLAEESKLAGYASLADTAKVARIASRMEYSISQIAPKGESKGKYVYLGRMEVKQQYGTSIARFHLTLDGNSPSNTGFGSLEFFVRLKQQRAMNEGIEHVNIVVEKSNGLMKSTDIQVACTNDDINSKELKVYVRMPDDHSRFIWRIYENHNVNVGDGSLLNEAPIGSCGAFAAP